LIDVIRLAGFPPDPRDGRISWTPFELIYSGAQTRCPVAGVVLPIHAFFPKENFKFAQRSIHLPSIIALKQVVDVLSKFIGVIPSRQQASMFCSQLTCLNDVDNSWLFLKIDLPKFCRTYIVDRSFPPKIRVHLDLCNVPIYKYSSHMQLSHESQTCQASVRFEEWYLKIFFDQAQWIFISSFITSFLQDAGHSGRTKAFFVVAVVPFVGKAVVVEVLTVDVDVVLASDFAGAVAVLVIVGNAFCINVAVVCTVVVGNAVAPLFVAAAEVCTGTATVVWLLLTTFKVETADEVAAEAFDSKDCEDKSEVTGVGAPDEVVSDASTSGGGAESDFDGAATPSAGVPATSSAWLGAVIKSPEADFGSCASWEASPLEASLGGLFPETSWVAWVESNSSSAFSGSDPEPASFWGVFAELIFDASVDAFSLNALRVEFCLLFIGMFEHELRPQHLTIFLLRDCNARSPKLP
jgi:hypothetical protein